MQYSGIITVMTELNDLIHDIKQPLSVVKGFTYLAVKAVSSDPDKAQQYLKKIDQQADVMTKLLNELNDLIKLKVKN